MIIIEIIFEAIKLILSLDKEIYRIIFLSLFVSGTSVALASMIGIPLGTLLGLQPLKKVRWLIKITYTLMGLPPVVGGLIVYLVISRQGPLGSLELLFSPIAMIIAQTILAIPIIAGLTSVSVRTKSNEIMETIQSLGADKRLVIVTLIKEARYGILGAIVAGMGRVIAEVGAVMMVGGNIDGHTRVLTTAIVLETRRGNFKLAMSLGIILILIAYVINSALYNLQSKGAMEND